MYDILIIGGGPAGLTAAIYGRRQNKTVLVIEKSSFGGQTVFSPKIENYPGFISMSGMEFADKLVDQVLAQGADVTMEKAISIEASDDSVTVVTEENRYEGKTLIAACGARHRLLGLPREEEYIGNGISFCAVCDGAFYKGKTVAVIGGGNSALQEALLLSDICSHVEIIQNLPTLTGEEQLIRQINEKPDIISIRYNTVVTGLLGDDTLTGITVKETDSKTSSENETTISLDGMFVAIGLVPDTEPLRSVISLDQSGYIQAGENCVTDKRRIFTAGDCRTKQIRQISTAAADGAIAALACCRLIDGK